MNFIEKLSLKLTEALTSNRETPKKRLANSFAKAMLQKASIFVINFKNEQVTAEEALSFVKSNNFKLIAVSSNFVSFEI